MNGLKKCLHSPGLIQDTITSSQLTDLVLDKLGLEGGGRTCRVPLLVSFGPPAHLSFSLLRIKLKVKTFFALGKCRLQNAKLTPL